MFTFAIIACNRLHYLRNCVRSVLRFVDLDRVRLLVIDNASTEQGTHEYLSELAKSEPAITIHRFKDRRPNELYRAMNFAVDFARGAGHEFVHFIQEDSQFLWHDATMLDRVRRLFQERADVAQAHVSLGWHGKVRKWQQQGGCELLHVANDTWLWPRNMPPCDTGITRVSLFDATGPYPESASLKGDRGQPIGEEWMYAQCRRLGLKRVYSLLPSLGMIPDGACVRGMERIGRYFPPLSEFYLRPLDAEHVRQIQGNAEAGVLSCNEEVSIPDGWSVESMRIRSEGPIEPIPVPAAA